MPTPEEMRQGRTKKKSGITGRTRLPPAPRDDMSGAYGPGANPINLRPLPEEQNQFSVPEGFSWYTPPEQTAQTPQGEQPPPGDLDLTQPGPMEDFFSNVLPLLGMKGFGQKQFEGPGQDFFNQPLWGAENTKGLIPQMTGPREGADAVTSAMGGLEGPGPAGDYWNQVQGVLGGPMGGEQYMAGRLPGVTQAGLGQQYAAQAVPGMMGQTGGQNLAAQQLQRLQGQMPDLQGGPGLDPYYENANRKAQERIRAQTAALGAYGGSAAADIGAEATTNLAAEQANREAQYRLQQLQEQRGWEGLAGQMAGQASAEQRGWADMLGGLTRGAEGLDIAREGLGADMAGAMQGLQHGRIGLGGDISGQAGAQDIARNTALGQLGLGAGNLDLAGLVAAASAGRGVDQDTLNQVVSGIRSGLEVDRYGLDKAGTFGGMAGAAQGARQGRIGQGYGMTKNMGDFLTNLAMGTYGGMGGQDAAFFDMIEKLNLGYTGAGAAGGRYMTNEGWNVANLLTSILAGK